MKIILAIEGAKGKNVVFVSDTMQAFGLEGAVQLAKQGKLQNIYAVNSKSGAYLRTSKSVPKKEQLEQLVVSSRQLFNFADDTRNAVSTPAVAWYLQLYEYTLQKNGGPFIVIEGKAKVTKEAVKKKLQAHRELIFTAAKKFSVDPYLLGAILIDEIAQFEPWEPITDPLFGYFIGINASAGIAQVKIETARGLVKNGYYNPDPSDQKFSPKNIGKVPRMHLYEYIKQPKHSIFFAAAEMRALIDVWGRFVNLNAMPEIIATLYHLPHRDPHGDPKPNERGLQIAGEFYQLAEEWLQ